MMQDVVFPREDIPFADRNRGSASKCQHDFIERKFELGMGGDSQPIIFCF